MDDVVVVVASSTKPMMVDVKRTLAPPVRFLALVVVSGESEVIFLLASSL